MSIDRRFRRQIERAYQDQLSRVPSEVEVEENYCLGLESVVEIAQRLRYMPEGRLRTKLGDEAFLSRRNAVTILYQELFQREPDYPAAIGHVCSDATITELRQDFLDSEEYCGK